MNISDGKDKKRSSRVGYRSECMNKKSSASNENKEEEDESFTDESLKDIYGTGIKNTIAKTQKTLDTSHYKKKKSSLASFKKSVSSHSAKDVLKAKDSNDNGS